MSGNVIVEKSKFFAIKIIRIYQFLTIEKKEYILSKQLLKSGTSIVANVRESVYGQSRPDFHTKLTISLKESSETSYWLQLLHETGYLSKDQFEETDNLCREIIRILIAITKQTKWRNS